MEDLIVDAEMHLQELQSSITVLKQAIGNEFEEVEKEDIHNHLEVLTDKIKIIVQQFHKINNKLIFLNK